MAMTNRRIPVLDEPTALAFSTGGRPVLEGEAARRFIREAKANEKKRGTQPIPEEYKVAFLKIMEKARKQGTIPF